MIDEEKFIEESFRRNFRPSDCIAIYGLGKNTKTIIERCKEYNVVCLMDKNRTGEKEWGMPILSIDDAFRLDVKKIVIIATSANVPIIYRRIASKCESYEIEVYDINGNRLQHVEEYRLNEIYNQLTWNALKDEIDHSDVISFDVFDTLLVRNTLYPTDVFELINNIARGIIDNLMDDFCKVRIDCERRLYLNGQPTIYDIYDEVQKETGISDKEKNILIRCEIETEMNCLHPRCRMLEAIKYARSVGKIICCTSDMYLTEHILRDLFEQKSIDGIDTIFVSCSEGFSKSEGLYEIVKKKYPGKTILHVGDNFDADIRCSKEYGIDKTFKISSIYQMISDSTIRDVLDCDASLNDRLEIGRLFSAQFNDPFLFSETLGKCIVRDNYSLGYYFIEPIIATFIEWMISECEKDEIELLLLGSRDGYILERMLRIRDIYVGHTVDYKYAYASRYACTLAGVKSLEDVKYAFSMAFDGKPEELLKKRFELKDSEILSASNSESDEQYLEKHIPLILEKANLYRRKFRKYFDKENIRGSNIGFFDFVSSGTCQMWLENIFPEIRWKGYYFIRTLDKKKEGLDIKSFFKPTYAYEKQSKLLKNYIFMENIMSSYEPSLRGFTDDGTPVFDRETRNLKQNEALKEIHDGIICAYNDRLSNGWGIPSQELSDEILNIVNDSFSIMKAGFFKNNYLDDSFCNRKFDLEKVIKTN